MEEIEVTDRLPEGWEEEEAPSAPDEGTPPEEGKETREEEQEGPAPAEELKLNYMGVERSVSREEAVELAQKGMDYDRIRGRLDTLTAEKEERDRYCRELEAALEASGQKPLDIIDRAAAGEMAADTGLPEEDCLRVVREARENREREQARSRQREEFIRKQAREFLRAYPQLGAFEKLPQSVWEAAQRGESLVGAYQAWELREARKAAEENRRREARRLQAEENRKAAAGSMRSRGGAKQDPFDALWYNGE